MTHSQLWSRHSTYLSIQSPGIPTVCRRLSARTCRASTKVPPSLNCFHACTFTPNLYNHYTHVSTISIGGDSLLIVDDIRASVVELHHSREICSRLLPVHLSFDQTAADCISTVSTSKEAIWSQWGSMRTHGYALLLCDLLTYSSLWLYMCVRRLRRHHARAWYWY